MRRFTVTVMDVHVVAVVVTFIWMGFSFKKDRVHVQL